MSTVEAIRARLQDGQRRAFELRGRIKDSTLKQYTRNADSVFEIVADCMSLQRLAEPRSPAALQWWLDQTDYLLSGGLAYVEYVEQIVAKFGDDAVVLSG
jgi:hypothetical protein